MILNSIFNFKLTFFIIIWNFQDINQKCELYYKIAYPT